jgi:hypothetical protein
MLLKCKRISDPYFGPHSDVEITTYYLHDSQNNVYKWHSGPNKEINCQVGDFIDGVVFRQKKIGLEKNIVQTIIDYKKSNPTIVNFQDMMNL